MIPDEAVEAAAHAYMQYPRTRGLDNTANMFRAALEAAAPHMLADYLLALAADVKIRGDIGKDGGVEAWDYLTRQAELIRTTT